MPRPAPSANTIGVLISGRGSNLLAILDRIAAGDLDARVALVISNEPSAAGLPAARARGVPTLVIDHRKSATREEHDQEMARALEATGARLICLAGYMRLLSGWFVDRFKGRILNIHPSLLPSFPGTQPQRQALSAGVKVSGCTVHFVDEQVDSGPILLQEAVQVMDDDTPEALEARILEAEHRVYSRAIALFFSGSLRIEGRRVLGSGPTGS
ncbi:MAG TPA: phosphoribosylglycinamide formyltransferase [Candidatus Polarisedimenticolia bacterium]|jgi:phosphoribosylglycinamide formyltransferase-1|nr:phosphoribosylglycinamide formyltransferase [Candidatus Polarisedimenticolia bacterium]